MGFESLFPPFAFLHILVNPNIPVGSLGQATVALKIYQCSIRSLGMIPGPPPQQTFNLMLALITSNEQEDLRYLQLV